jgi:hypothetical protein
MSLIAPSEQDGSYFGNEVSNIHNARQTSLAQYSQLLIHEDEKTFTEMKEIQAERERYLRQRWFPYVD